MNNAQKRDFLTAVFYWGVVAFGVFVSARFLLRYLLPFLLAGLLGWLVQRPARRIRKWLHLPVGICAVGLTVLIFLAISAALASIFWGIGFGGKRLLERLPQLLTAVNARTDSVFTRLERGLQKMSATDFEWWKTTLLQWLNTLFSGVTEKLSAAVGGMVAAVPSLLLATLVTVISGCYVAYDFNRFCRFLTGFIPKKYMQTACYVKDIFVHQTVRIVWGYTRLSAVAFSLLAAGLFLLKIPHFLTVAALIAAVDLLPVFGSGAVLLPWAVFSFLSAQYGRGIGLTVLYAVTVIVRNILEPRIIGRGIGLHPLFTLIILFVGLKIGGVGGMIVALIALPVALELYRNPPQFAGTQISPDA